MRARVNAGGLWWRVVLCTDSQRGNASNEGVRFTRPRALLLEVGSHVIASDSDCVCGILQLDNDGLLVAIAQHRCSSTLYSIRNVPHTHTASLA